MHQLGHIPEYGESMTEQGYKFSVEKRTDKAIVQLKIESIYPVRSPQSQN
jgi:CBS domain containing-hemolysin-like protein